GAGAADLAGVFAHTYLTAAAQEGAEAMRGGSLTQFERLCDNALTAYLSQGKRVAFGEHPLIGYLYAKENELTTIRIILTGRLAGLDAETIRERLRESYV
ncbi:V-type ATPase subunit, partial [Intestinimonas aquisgranensis]|nr:V-type ATPase subunit [Intestinimonas aquisgranensis]